MPEILVKPVQNQETEMDHLYDYLFHYNHIRGTWRAFRREHSVRYFNGELGENELFIHEDIKALTIIVVKEAAKSSN